MNFGFSEKTLNCIIDSIKELKEIEAAKIFGSRALGNYKRGSDVDLALIGPEVDEETVLKLSRRLNQELPLPYHFDVLAYGNIKNKALVEHIDQFGIVIFTRGNRGR